MEEKKIVALKKEEFALKEMIKNRNGKGKMSKVRIEYTPVGEKIIIKTAKPGFIIGRMGENIEILTKMIKENFNFENPRIEIEEIKEPNLDAQTIADEIAWALERFGPLKFKAIAYRTLQKIIDAGALGAEIRLSGKLPGSRARPWRFAQGYLKKTGDEAKVVDYAKARAETKPGTVGIKVKILPPKAILKDRIEINEELIKKLKKQKNEDKENKIKEKKK